MPGTVREGAKEDDPCINPGHLGWKIKQRGGIKIVRVGSVHSLTPSVAVHQAPSLRKASSSCPATPGGQARQRGEPPLSVLDLGSSPNSATLLTSCVMLANPSSFSDCFFISKMRMTEVPVCRVTAELEWRSCV